MLVKARTDVRDLVERLPFDAKHHLGHLRRKGVEDQMLAEVVDHPGPGLRPGNQRNDTSPTEVPFLHYFVREVRVRGGIRTSPTSDARTVVDITLDNPLDVGQESSVVQTSARMSAWNRK